VPKIETGISPTITSNAKTVTINTIIRKMFLVCGLSKQALTKYKTNKTTRTKIRKPMIDICIP
jgi:hypothetical protein